MMPLSEVGNQTQQFSPHHQQSAVIPSVEAQTKVVAVQSSATSGDAGGRSSNQQFSDQSRTPKRAMASETALMAGTKSEQWRSIVEAQEADNADKIKAAFALQHDLKDLLSVIRDPEDQILPDEPANLGD